MFAPKALYEERQAYQGAAPGDPASRDYQMAAHLFDFSLYKEQIARANQGRPGTSKLENKPSCFQAAKELVDLRKTIIGATKESTAVSKGAGEMPVTASSNGFVLGTPLGLKNQAPMLASGLPSDISQKDLLNFEHLGEAKPYSLEGGKQRSAEQAAQGGPQPMSAFTPLSPSNIFSDRPAVPTQPPRFPQGLTRSLLVGQTRNCFSPGGDH